MQNARGHFFGQLGAIGIPPASQGMGCGIAVIGEAAAALAATGGA